MHASVGDVVIILDDNVPRCRWRMGKIERLIRGKDDNIRGASVKTTSNSGHISFLDRQKLFPVEVVSDIEMDTLDIPDEPVGRVQIDTPTFFISRR